MFVPYFQIRYHLMLNYKKERSRVGIDPGNNLEPLMIPLRDIKLATNDFSLKCAHKVSKECTLYKAELKHYGFEMILIIDNVSNGYLNDYLGNANAMRHFTWEKRLKICIDVAHALKYLHSEMKDQNVIINHAIQSNTIGLDEN
ncbi:hypothetical protein E3N88_00181 [Mikania micrantha]|uniref:Protein kinase domain-containing protein n=1 Tax=Mikania micrantha TaxID=192012 RepID=A0A5N6PXB5_9ASTR|nr:hypothetical protein E3N88_00181 [Mikania micrantha]